MVPLRTHSELKLIILEEPDEARMRPLRDEEDTTPRVYRNTLFFLTTFPGERPGFSNLVRDLLAYQRMHEDAALNLLPAQRNKLKVRLKRPQGDLPEGVR